MTDRSHIAQAKRVVIKVGTNALTHDTGRFHREHFERLAHDIASAADAKQVIVVSSGAIAFGVERLGLLRRPRDVPGKQACAAVGQSRLMRAWEEALAPRVVAQILLTHADVQDRRRYLNARHTFLRLLSKKVIPVINENDTVSVDEIKFGDNDTLAGLVAGLVSADALIILSDVEGLYDLDPRLHSNAKLVSEVPRVTRAMLNAVRGTSSAVGTGGMVTKLRAAMQVSEMGIPCIIAAGHRPGIVAQVLRGEAVGTCFAPQRETRQARVSWIAHVLKPKGRIWVDDGACAALTLRKKSLLPSGIVRVDGNFSQGEPVDLINTSDVIFARGLSAYDAAELKRILGKQTSQLESVLGYRGLDEAVHRNDLALLIDDA